MNIIYIYISYYIQRGWLKPPTSFLHVAIDLMGESWWIIDIFTSPVATKTPPEALASAMAPDHATPPEDQFSWGYSGDILCETMLNLNMYLPFQDLYTTLYNPFNYIFDHIGMFFGMVKIHVHVWEYVVDLLRYTAINPPSPVMPFMVGNWASMGFPQIFCGGKCHVWKSWPQIMVSWPWSWWEHGHDEWI